MTAQAEGRKLLRLEAHQHLDGIDVFRVPMASRKRLGVLPDVHGLYPRLTPREHVRYFAELHGIDARRADQRCDALFQLLNTQLGLFHLRFVRRGLLLVLVLADVDSDRVLLALFAHGLSEGGDCGSL